MVANSLVALAAFGLAGPLLRPIAGPLLRPAAVRPAAAPIAMRLGGGAPLSAGPPEDIVNAFRKLGVFEDAPYDVVDKAFESLMAQYKGNTKQEIQLKVAKDKVMDWRLRQRMSGALKPLQKFGSGRRGQRRKSRGLSGRLLPSAPPAPSAGPGRNVSPAGTSRRAGAPLRERPLWLPGREWPLTLPAAASRLSPAGEDRRPIDAKKPLITLPPWLEEIAELPTQMYLLTNLCIFGVLGVMPIISRTFASTSISLAFGLSMFRLYNRGAPETSNDEELQLRAPSKKAAVLTLGICMLSAALGGVASQLLKGVLFFASEEFAITLCVSAGLCFACSFFKVQEA